MRACALLCQVRLIMMGVTERGLPMFPQPIARVARFPRLLSSVISTFLELTSASLLGHGAP